MEQDKEKTKVIFRKFRDGDIIALFPEVPSDPNGYHCQSYMHVGQHGGASPVIVQSTKLATPQEYSELKEELESLGYNLDIRERFPANDIKIRRDILKSWGYE